MRLSHSAKNTLTTCGHKWKLHYIDKWRSVSTPTTLVFGSIVDEALNTLMEGGDWLQVVISEFKKAQNDDLQFFLVDCDYDKELESAVRRWEVLSPQDRNTYQTLILGKMQAKAILICEEYTRVIMPRVKKVVSVQKDIRIDRNGYWVSGKLDAIFEWEDGKTYIVDNKTASALYKDDAADISPQLATYAEAENIYDVMFVVALKKLKKVRTCVKCGAMPNNANVKTCPEVSDGYRCRGEFDTILEPVIQVVTGKADPKQRDEMLESFDGAAKQIKAKIFTKNLSACDRQYGRQCEFFDLCKNKKTNGLIQLNNKEKK